MCTQYDYTSFLNRRDTEGNPIDVGGTEGKGNMENVKIVTRMSAVLMVAAGTMLASSAESATVMAASGGSPFDSSQVECFHKDWNNPARVSFSCDPVANGWWDMVVPITSTGTKTLSFYSTFTTPINTECDAFVFGADGSISRWDSQLIGTSSGWHSFAGLAVNTNESAEIECLIPAGSFGENWVSAVKGF